MESIAELRALCRRENDEDNRKTMFLASRVSIYFTRLFLMMNMSANQVTYLFIVLGIAGSFSFLGPGPYWALAGYILMRLHVIADVCDGEVARYRRTFSSTGAYLDFLTHYLVYGIVLFAIPLRCYMDFGRFWSVTAGFVLVLSNTMNRASVDCWFRANFGKKGRDEIEEGGPGRKRSSLSRWRKTAVLLASHSTSLQTFLNFYIAAVILERLLALDLRLYLIPAYAAALSLFTSARIALTIARGRIPRRATYYS